MFIVSVYTCLNIWDMLVFGKTCEGVVYFSLRHTEIYISKRIEYTKECTCTLNVYIQCPIGVIGCNLQIA